MLSEELQNKILRLIECGTPEADICRKLEVSRNAVRRLMKKDKKSVLIRRFALLLKSLTYKTKVGRCPTCGMKCYLPCKSCLMKQYDMLLSISTEEEQSVDECKLELKPKEQKRYEEIRKNRENAKNKTDKPESDK